MAKLEFGKKVKVYNMDSAGKQIFEGTATLCGHLRDSEERPKSVQQWTVQFEGDPGKYARWVNSRNVIDLSKKSRPVREGFRHKKTIKQLRRMSLDKLRQLAKKEQIHQWYNKKKDVLIQQLDPRDPVTAFLEDGGSIQILRPQKDPKRKAPTQYSAECNPHHSVAKKSRKKKKSGSSEITKKLDRIGIPELSKEVGITPAKTRRILRDNKVPKPGPQWYWEKDHKDLKAIRKLLKGVSK